jgi:hypothetical protein
MEDSKKTILLLAAEIKRERAKGPEELDMDAFLSHHYTGHIGSTAYKRYQQEGGLEWLGSKSKYPILLHQGKYGPYLNYDNKLYGVPQCFQKSTFKLDDAIKIIKFKQQTHMSAPQARRLEQEEEDIIKKLDREPKGVSEDLDDIIKKVKSKKKVLD